MYLISAEGYDNAGGHTLKIKKAGEIWVSIKHVHDGLGVKNMSDLILKEINGSYGTKNLTKEQIRRYKMTEREIFETHDNLSKNELNKKSNKNVYAKNNIMTFVIKHCRGEEKKGERSIGRFRKKLMISESEI